MAGSTGLPFSNFGVRWVLEPLLLAGGFVAGGFVADDLVAVAIGRDAVTVSASERRITPNGVDAGGGDVVGGTDVWTLWS